MYAYSPSQTQSDFALGLKVGSGLYPQILICSHEIAIILLKIAAIFGNHKIVFEVLKIGYITWTPCGYQILRELLGNFRKIQNNPYFLKF